MGRHADKRCELSEEDRLRLETQKAEAERDAAMAKLALQGGGPGAAGKPTPPPETEAAGWIADADTVEKLLAVSWDRLPLKDGITIRQGTGARKLAVFVDPNCGYCRRFERDLATVKDVTVHVFLIPILGPDSVAKSRDIWCARDPAVAWRRYMLEGVQPSKLRMVIVKVDLPATSTRPAESVGHMVLAYYPQPDADPLVLDNLTDEIRPASLRPDLKPVFSFNTEGLWQGVGQQSMGDPMARISKWRDAMNRIKAEGF